MTLHILYTSLLAINIQNENVDVFNIPQHFEVLISYTKDQNLLISIQMACC